MRVLVMRPERESAAVAARLEAMGYRVAVAPVTTIVPLVIDRPLVRCDALLVTSVQACAALSPDVRDALKGRPVYAVGRATAAAARHAGFGDIRIAAGDIAALSDLLRLTLPQPAHLLYLAGRVRKPELEAGLVAMGHRVTLVETYDAVEADWSDTLCADLRADPPGAALHFSRQSAARACAASDRHGLAAVWAAVRHVCLSVDVAEILRGNATRIIVAERPDLESLLQALDATIEP